MDNFYSVTGTLTRDNLVASQQVPILTAAIVLAAGQGILKRGTVIGKVTASGKGMTVDKGASDGKQNAYGILTDDVDTTADAKATVYVSGLFNRNALLFGGNTDTAADHEAKLRELGIFLANNIAY